MAIPPPPYANIAGISRADMKDNAQETLAQYNGNARPGELVVDLTTYQLYIGNSNGNLNLVSGGGNGGGTPGGSDTQIQYNNAGAFAGAADFTYSANTLNIPNTVVSGNLIPGADNVYSLGSNAAQWSDLYVSANTIYINRIPVSGNSTTLTYNSQPVVIASNSAPAQTANIATTANVVAGNVVISNATPGGGVTFPDGSVQTTAAVTNNYGNANVVANLAALGTNPVSTTGNVSASSFVATGTVDAVSANISGLYAYSNTIAAHATTMYLDPGADGSPLTGDLVVLGNISATGNLTYTSVTTATTSNLVYNAANNASNAAAASGGGITVGPPGTPYASLTYDATNNVWLSNIGITSLDVIEALAFAGDGSQLTNLPQTYTDSNVSAYLAGGTDTANIITSGNVNATFFNGNGRFLTGLPDGYSNAKVSTYLASGTDTAGYTTVGAISATGNIGTAAAVNASTVSASGNVTGANFIGNVAAASVTGLGNVSTINLNGNASTVLAGDGTWVAQSGGGNSTYGDANVAAYLASGTNTSNIITTGDIVGATGLLGAYAAPGDWFVRNDGTSVSMGQFAAQSITVGGSGIQIAGTGGVSIQGAANANVSIGGGTTGNVLFPKGITFADGTYQNTAGGGGSAYTDANVSAYLASGNNTAGYSTSGTIVASGNISTGSSVVANGSVVGGNITTAGTVTAATGNITTVNATTVAATTGNITTVNATTVNTTTATATGNIVGGNLTTAGVVNADSVTATGNVTAAAIVSGNITSPSVTISATGATQNITLSATGNIDVANAVVNNVGAPLSANDAATKAYVDANASGLKVIGSSRLATAAALPAYTYTNGTAGVGATITASANGALTVDGVLANLGDRILVKNETVGNAPYNGVYVVTDPGSAGLPFVLTRATDDDQAADIPGAYTLVTAGATQANTGWSQATPAPIVVGTTAISWSQFSSQTTYSAGNAMSLNGTVFNVVPDGITTEVNGSNQIAVKASANLTTPILGAATFTSLTPTANTSGNVTAGNLLTDNYLWANGTPVDFSSTLINNGNSNVEIATADGNITMAVNGNAVFTLSEATVAIGLAAGETAQGIAAIAIGAGTAMDTQGNSAVAIGAQAGNTTQGIEAVAIGASAGYNAQGAGAIAIGAGAGNSAQSAGAVAIGAAAGQSSQGVNAVAIGALAGQTSQAANSIIINASGGAVNSTNSGFYVAPVRNDTGNVTNAVYYNTTTKEVTYGPLTDAYGNANVSNYLAANTTNVTMGGDLVVQQGTTLNTVEITGSLTANGASPAPSISNFSTIQAIDGLESSASITAGSFVTAIGNIITNGYFLGNISAASGKIANAAYADVANVAYNVALANVAGAGNVASINLNSSATAYLSGAGTWTTPPGTYGNGNVSSYLASGTNSTGYTTTGNVVAAQGQFGALQAPTPVFNNGALATVLTTTATAFQATLSVQYGNTLGSPTSTQMMQVLATQDATGNASYSVFNRINSNTSVPAAVVTLTAPSAGTLALNVNTAGANAYITCTVTKF